MKSHDVFYVNDGFENEENTIDQKDTKKFKEEPPHESHGSTDSGKCMKISKTVALTFGLVALGLFLEIAGPSLDYLQDLIDGSTEEVSRVLVARSVGYLVGSLFGGYLCDRFSRQVDILISVSYLLAAIGTIAAPWCQDIVLLGFMFCLQGLAQGTICTGGNAVVIKLWGENTGAPLVAQHLAFGVGALLAPQVVNGFVHEKNQILSGNSSHFTTLSIELTTEAPSDMSDVKYAYVIVGTLAACFALLFLIFYFTDKASRTKSIESTLDFREILNPGSCADGDTIFGISFFIFFFIMYIHIVGGERAFSKYFFKFTTDSHYEFSESQAANIMSLFWLCFTIGRAVNMAAAHFLSPVLIMIVVVTANVINGILLAVWGNSEETLLWVEAAAFGFFLAPVFPTALVWANEYVTMTAVCVSLGYVGSAVGDIIYQYLGGYLFDEEGPESLMYLLCGYSICLAVFYVIAQIIASHHGKRSTKNKKIKDKQDIDIIVVKMCNNDKSKF